ncbi:MAG: hypothetical protein SGCHY_000374 [Lobulomycetales sp.]
MQTTPNSNTRIGHDRQIESDRIGHERQTETETESDKCERPSQAVLAAVSKCPSVALSARTFFVAWNGVLCLAFSGFPRPLAALKTALLLHPGPPENFGSKWPKISLAALNDTCSLSQPQFHALTALAASLEPLLHGTLFEIDHLTLVRFHCRSLESLHARARLPLSGSPHPDSFLIDPCHLELVNSVLEESSDPDYFSKVSAPGNRIPHYRAPHTEDTLVAYIGESAPAIRHAINLFREAVDALLPGMYQWMHPEALHVTILGMHHRDAWA